MFGWNRRRHPDMVAFDAIGTLFPLDPLEPLSAALGLPPGAHHNVYSTAIRDSIALAAIGEHRPFKAAMAAALDEVLAHHRLNPSPRARATVLDGLKLLAARPDAAAAFRTLHDAGIAVGVLSNGSLRDTKALLGRTGLAPLVDLVASAERPGLSKPRPEVYEHMARQARLRPRRLALVAVHAWDVNGAAAAGLITAYVSAEQPYSPLMRRPDIEAPTLLDAARALVAL